MTPVLRDTIRSAASRPQATVVVPCAAPVDRPAPSQVNVCPPRAVVFPSPS